MCGMKKAAVPVVHLLFRPSVCLSKYAKSDAKCCIVYFASRFAVLGFSLSIRMMVTFS
jgi:hypothetical protein